VPAARVSAPLIDEYFAHLECRVAGTALVVRYCFFVLEVIQVWLDPAVKMARTLHHRSNGNLLVAATIKLNSKMK